MGIKKRKIVSLFTVLLLSVTTSLSQEIGQTYPYRTARIVEKLYDKTEQPTKLYIRNNEEDNVDVVDELAKVVGEENRDGSVYIGELLIYIDEYKDSRQMINFRGDYVYRQLLPMLEGLFSMYDIHYSRLMFLGGRFVSKKHRSYNGNECVLVLHKTKYNRVDFCMKYEDLTERIDDTVWRRLFRFVHYKGDKPTFRQYERVTLLIGGERKWID